MRVWGEGPLPTERYLAARRHAENMRHYSIHEGRPVDGMGGLRANSLSASSLSSDATLGGWNALGPGNIGGRTRSLVINPKSPNIMYAGAVTGGVWKSTDSGTTWNPITDLTPSIYIGSMIMDPADPNTIYAGTGESYQGARGYGILKTTDGGATWTQLAATNNSSYWFVNKLAITPNKNIYAATSSGIFVSQDGGATWTNSLNKTTCEDMVARSDGKTDYLFATCAAGTSSQPRAIYRNVDAAGTGAWINVFSVSKMGRTSIAIAPSLQSTVYAMSWSTDPQPTGTTGLVGVFRSTASGDPATWTTQTSNADPNRLNTALLTNPSGLFADVCSGGKPSYAGQGWYDNVLAVDPIDPNRVWAGGVDVFRSDDGGANWGIAAYWDRGGRPEFAHADNHGIVFHPAYDGVANQTMFLTNDGGLFRSDNTRADVATGTNAQCYPTAGKVAWVTLNHGYLSTQFYHGLPYPGGAAYMGGAQDNGTPRGQIQTGINGWSAVYGGDGGWVAIDPVDPNNIYYEYVAKATYRSVDGGLTTLDATNGITEPSDNFEFIKQIVMDPSASQRLYVGGSILWRTNDGAANWSAVSTAISSGSITAIAVSPSNPNVVFFGTTQGRVYSNTSALSAGPATTWSSSLPRVNGSIQSLAVDPTNPKTVYAVYTTFKNNPSDNHVYKSGDGGITWTGIDGSGVNGIPDIPVSAILIDPLNPSTVYLGTDLGVYVSNDGGGTWSRDANPFANTVVTALTIDRTGSQAVLYAFTYGRGAWKVNLPGSGSACTYSLDSNSATVPAAGGSTSINLATEPGCSWAAFPGSSFATVQSPAGGSGPGPVFVVGEMNYGTGPRTDSVIVQGMPVRISQPGSARVAANDEVATATVVSSLPYGAVSSPPYTESSTDPVHSCSKSADFNTAWWIVTAPSTGKMEIEGAGYYNVAAYAVNAGAAGAELACLDNTNNYYGSTRFNVTQGTQYLIETSLHTSDRNFIRGLAIRMVPPIAVSVTPAAASVDPGETLQLKASVTGSPNTAVRWSVNPVNGTIAGSVSPAGLYTAPAVASSQPVTVTASSLADPTVAGSATLSLGPPSAISVTATGVLNAATFRGGAVSPGEIVTIFGSGFGPAKLTGLSLTSAGKVSSTIGATQILFDGIPAPLIYAAPGQVSAIVPYEVSGKATSQMQVQEGGGISAAVSIPITTSVPGLFTANSSGTGQISMFNQDGSLNGPGHPAPRGSIVVFYGTGEGATTPASTDGQVNAASFPKPAVPVTITIGGQPATSIPYFGAAPGFVAGVFQGNVTIPVNAPSGAAVPIVVRIGANSSPSNVTMVVQ